MATLQLLMFSGTQDPIHTLSPTDAAEVLRALSQGQRLVSTEPPLSILGYRGIEVELTAEESAATGLPAHFWIANGQSEDEDGGAALALDLARRHFAVDLAEHLPTFRQAATRHREKKGGAAIQAGPTAAVTGTLAIYNPQKYNSNPVPRIRNNCYAYGCDLPTNTFPQPGRKHGYYLGPSSNATTVLNYSLSDGLINAAPSPASLPGGPAYYVALVFSPAPILDYHWYRQVASNGEASSWPKTFWSHKPGQTEVTNLDNEGKVITNPETCDRGIYTEWVGYLWVPQSTVQIV